MTPSYLRPRLLAADDILDGFECRSPEQTEWLAHHARRANATGTAKVLVVTEQDAREVVAYYAWAMASITVDAAPARLRKGAGRYPQPVTLLARLGVDIAHERRGLGAGLLKDVIGRVAELGTTIGCRGLLIHAETEAARDFYLHLIAEFEPSPTDPLHLVLLMKDVHHTLRASGLT
ncbi:MAG: N-acetyltransferase [Actinomycetia bacterium]|nr:N-acetyltransferase [Actinomycetes bacterium]